MNLLQEQLRTKGHQLIDDLEALGVSKEESYRRIRKVLGVPPLLAHFSQMYTPKTLHKAIKALEEYKEIITNRAYQENGTKNKN